MNIGDRVTVQSEKSRHNGKYGTIVGVSYKVRFDDGHDSAFVDDSLVMGEIEIKEKPKMNLREANDILQNPKEHWSHEIDDAKKYCINAVKYLVNAADYRFMDEARIAIKYIDERISVVSANEDAMCGNCCWFDPVGCCQDELDPKTKFVSPIDDASNCPHYRPYPKEAIK